MRRPISRNANEQFDKATGGSPYRSTIIILLTGITFSASPAAGVGSVPQIPEGNDVTSAVAVTGVSISVSPPPVESGPLDGDI